MSRRAWTGPGTPFLGGREQQRVFVGRSGGGEETARYAGPHGPQGRASVAGEDHIGSSERRSITRVTLRPREQGFHSGTLRNTCYRMATPVYSSQDHEGENQRASAAGGARGDEQSGHVGEGRHGRRPDRQ